MKDDSLMASEQLDTPITAVIFDCDGTLSSIEGIDELAKLNNAEDIVQRLTQEAMSKSGMNEDLYQKRLSLVKPTLKEVEELGQIYIQYQVRDALAVIKILSRLNKSIYIISAGLSPAIHIFGKYLDIPEENITCVSVQFDKNGNYIDFDRTSPIVHKNGKREIVKKIKLNHQNIALIGDGFSDYETYDLVTRFVGYGGAFYRENLEKLCQHYIRTASLAPLLPIILTSNEYQQLNDDERKLYQKGIAAVV